jgi:RHS repeat-associated protein
MRGPPAQDGLGSVTSLSNNSGALSDKYVYDSFGKLLSSSENISNYLRYTARESDSTGLYYYRARYYGNGGGRFLSEDPIRFFSDANFYRYVANNPIIFSDPTGYTCSCTFSQSKAWIICRDDFSGYIVASASAYSGTNVNGYAGLNNPAMQSVPFNGPIPQGAYSIGSAYYSHKLGPLTIPLTPLPGTNTFGRWGFNIHGDTPARNHTASEGCIVTGSDVRQAIANCGGGVMTVVQ